MARIKLIGTVQGIPTEHDGRWLVEYDPSMCQEEGYIVLKTTDKIEEAKVFASGAEALATWRQSVGLRPDGKLNRPLTAWTVSIE